MNSPNNSPKLLSRAACGSLLVLGLQAHSQKPVQLPHPKAAQPLQAVLLAPLDIARVHAGSTLLARLDTGWSDPTCTLLPGSLVRGHIAAATKRSKMEKNSSLQLSFDGADCRNNPNATPHFSVIAMVGPLASSNNNGQSGVSESAPLSNDLPLAIGGGFRQVSTASNITTNFNLPARNLPSSVLPGQVIDVSKTSLEPGGGINGASVITAYRADVRLEAGTTLVLVPGMSVLATASSPHPGSPAASSSSSGSGTSVAPIAASATLPPPEPPDITELCASGKCSTDPGRLDTQALAHAQASIELSSYGYVPASNRELARFPLDQAVVYLGPSRVLCTFDPRHLRSRTEFDGESSRTIRAVLVDTSSFTVLRVFDWRVRGNGQYLWQLASGHLLVHIGRQLQEFSQDLQPLSKIELGGRIAWVSASPSGEYIAVGTVRERYSLAYRNELARELPDEPEEDIEVRVYDSHFQQLMSVLRSSHAPAPVLSDSGEVRVQPEGRDRWRISQINWNREQHTLAVSRSSCRPVLSSPEHGLIFMTGCNTTGGRWYRMLHDDGHPVLKGTTSSNELELSAHSSGPQTFAIRTVEADHTLDLTQPFRPSDLRQERISIYNSSTGSRLSSLATNDFAPAEQGYALSPQGNQLTLIGRSALHFYPVSHTVQ